MTHFTERLTFERFLTGLLFVVIATIACLMPAQNDTFWHVRAGYEMLREQSVMLVDAFSHSIHGQPWPNYEWLTQIVFAAIHAVGGMPLLTAVCAAAATGGLAFVHAALQGDAVLKVLVMTGVMSGVTITWSLRPQALTLLLLGATIWLVTRQRWVWLPPLFLMWANLHGAVALGGVVLVGAVLGHLWHERSLPVPLAVTVLLCGAATLLTPLGLTYWHEIAASIARSQINEIAEWRRPHGPPEHLVFWAAAVALPVLILRGRSRLDTATAKGLACSGLLALVLAMRAMRNISPFLMIVAPTFTLLMARGRAWHSDPHSTVRGWAHALMLCAAIGVGGLIVGHAWSGPAARLGWQPLSPGAAAAVEECPGPIYNRYADGGPIIYFAPRQPVLLDSRQDPYPTWLVHVQHEIERGADYHPLFETYGLKCAVVPPTSTLVARLLSDGWKQTFANDGWVVVRYPSVDPFAPGQTSRRARERDEQLVCGESEQDGVERTASGDLVPATERREHECRQ